jgi:hypothetical protein
MEASVWPVSLAGEGNRRSVLTVSGEQTRNVVLGLKHSPDVGDKKSDISCGVGCSHKENTRVQIQRCDWLHDVKICRAQTPASGVPLHTRPLTP